MTADPRSTDWPEPFTEFDYLVESLRQVREMEAARRAWHEAFERDQKRIEEWKL
jgi:hypothetical protein